MAQAIKLATEAQHLFQTMLALSSAVRSGDAVAIFEAKDEMEVLEMHAYNPQIKARAARALATL